MQPDFVWDVDGAGAAAEEQLDRQGFFASFMALLRERKRRRVGAAREARVVWGVGAAAPSAEASFGAQQAGQQGRGDEELGAGGAGNSVDARDADDGTSHAAARRAARALEDDDDDGDPRSYDDSGNNTQQCDVLLRNAGASGTAALWRRHRRWR